MTPMPRPPWSYIPTLEWDDDNMGHIARHGVTPWEVEELLLAGGYDVRPHKKRRKAAKYRNRYVIFGQTLGGRNLVVFIDRLSDQVIRPVTAFGR